jgi:hypothetical protein
MQNLDNHLFYFVFLIFNHSRWNFNGYLHIRVWQDFIQNMRFYPQFALSPA